MSKRKYRVNLNGLERKNFSLGSGKNLTLMDGTLLTEGHEFIKLFPTFVKEVVDVEAPKQLLVEEPIETAEVEKVDVETQEEEIVKEAEEVKEDNYKEVIKSTDNKEDLVEFAKEYFGIKLAKNKSLENMKTTLLSKIEG